ncbi:hypothetical protein [Bartonella sp. CB60]
MREDVIDSSLKYRCTNKKVGSLPLLDEEVQRKPRRRRTAASSLA